MGDNLDDVKAAADKFWAYGDYLAGFQTAQTVGFLIGMGASKDLRDKVIEGWGAIVLFFLVFAGLYVLAIKRCNGEEMVLRRAAGQSQVVLDASETALKYRICCVLIIALLGIMGVILQPIGKCFEGRHQLRAGLICLPSK